MLPPWCPPKVLAPSRHHPAELDAPHTLPGGRPGVRGGNPRWPPAWFGAGVAANQSGRTNRGT
jgi:hypothetical protein